MWFKQANIYQVKSQLAYEPTTLETKLDSHAFKPCLPSLPSSHGWAAPLDIDNAPLVHAASGYMLICLQIEEKVLPAAVIKQNVDERIKEIEGMRERKVTGKEKRDLKDEAVRSLLPKAFTKPTRIYGYFDTKNQWLIINTTNANKLERFIETLKRSVDDIELTALEAKYVKGRMTDALLNDKLPTNISIEQSCVLGDPNDQGRSIRCQQQDLSAGPIQTLLTEGCQAEQVAFNWQDHLSFTLTHEFGLKRIRYHDELLEDYQEDEIESPEAKFDADFVIMTQSLSILLKELIAFFSEERKTKTPEAAIAA